MSSFEPISPATSTQGRTPSLNPSTARSGGERAVALQSVPTTKAAAPVATTKAILQAQAAEKPRIEAPLPPKQTPIAGAARPITAVLLHELRLQQELSDVQNKLEKPTG